MSDPPKPEKPSREPPKGSTVSFWVRDAATHDRLLKIAKDRRMTLSRYMAAEVERILSR